MKKTVLIFALLLIFLCQMLCGAAEESFLSTADAYFERLAKRKNPVGMSVMAAIDGETVYSFCYGTTDKKSKTPVQTNTLFRAASVTKLVSALGVMRLWEEEKIDLDEPLSNYYAYAIENPYHHEAITLRQVMTHTSSVSSDATLYPRWENENAVQKLFTRSQPGHSYRYANLNGGILGSLIENITGLSVQGYMKETLFEPLNLKASYDPLEIEDASLMASVYNKDGSLFSAASNYVKKAETALQNPSSAPHFDITVGDLWISAENLLRIGIMMADGGALDSVRVLQEKTVRLMQQNQAEEENTSVHCDSPYGLMLFRLEDETLSHVWYGHQGSKAGLTTDLFYEPQNKAVVVMIMNGCGHTNQNEVSVTFLQTLQFLTQNLLNSDEAFTVRE